LRARRLTASLIIVLLFSGGALYLFFTGGGPGGDGRRLPGGERTGRAPQDDGGAIIPASGVLQAAAPKPAVAEAQDEEQAAEEDDRPIALEGRVLSADGDPVAAARVMVLDARAWAGALEEHREELERDPLEGIRELRRAYLLQADEMPAARTGADGSYAFRGLAPGEYRVLVEHPEHLPHRGTWVMIDAAAAARCDVTLAPAQAIAGKILDGAGKPIAGAEVRAELSETARAKGVSRLMHLFVEQSEGGLLLSSGASSGDDGAFRLGALEPRPYDLEVRKEGYATAVLRKVPPGASGVTVVLGPGLGVAGRILSAERKPVAGVEVVLRVPLVDIDDMPPEMLAQVEIDFLGERTRRGTGGDDGRFLLHAGAGGSYELAVRAPGFPPHARKLVVEGALTELGDIVLEPDGGFQAYGLPPGLHEVELERLEPLRPRAAGSAAPQRIPLGRVEVKAGETLTFDVRVP
jgi:protocatechuate 3,4-dioxygenase beta subunit